MVQPRETFANYLTARNIDVNSLSDVIQKTFQEYLQQERLHDVESLQKYCGLTPCNEILEEQVERYLSKLNKESFDKIKLLERITKLAGLEKIVQKKYSVYFNTAKINFDTAFGEIRALKHFFKEMQPSENSIQEFYKYCVEVDKFAELERIKDETGILPKLPFDFVQKQYLSYLKENVAIVDMYVKRLADISKILPQIESSVIQEVYERYFNNELLTSLKGCDAAKLVLTDDALKNIVTERLNIIETIGGSKPSQKIIQDAYTSFVKNERLRLVKILKDITGIEPTLSENTIQESFATALQNEHLDDVETLQKTMQKSPKDTLVQDAYLKYLQSNEIHLCEKLSKITKTKPQLPIKIVEKNLVQYVQTEEFSNLKILMDLTGMLPSTTAIEEKQIMAAKGGKLDVLTALENCTGIHPSPATHKAFIEFLIKK